MLYIPQQKLSQNNLAKYRAVYLFIRRKEDVIKILLGAVTKPKIF